MFLDKYSKSSTLPTASEGTSFAQHGKAGWRGGEKDSTSNKKEENRRDKWKDPYKDMECFKCGKKGHLTRFCPEKHDDDSTITSKFSKSGKKNFKKQLKSVKKSFAQLQTALESNEESDSSDEQSHFQFLHVKHDLETVLNQMKH